MDNNSIENTDLAKQYQDIPDRYSRELATTEKPLSEAVQESPTVAAEVPTPEMILAPPVEPLLTETVPAAPLIIPPTVEPVFTPPSPVFESVAPPTDAPKNNFFKYLFYLSLIIFLGVFGAIAYTIFFAKTASVAPVVANPTSTESLIPTSAEMFCEANGQKFKLGESFPAADGCNTCTCSQDLTIACTLKACEATPSVTSAKTTPPKTTPTKAITPTITGQADLGPLKGIVASINKQLKTNYSEVTLDSGKSWSVNLTKSSTKANILTIKKAITDAGLGYQASLSGEAGADWKEVYTHTADTCTLSDVQSVLTLSCGN